MRVYTRGPLTDTLLDYFTAGLTAATLDLGVGDGIAPPDRGWQGGQPGVGPYKPYTVLSALAATPNLQPAMRGDTSSWQQPYSLLCVGGSRQQADWASDSLRILLSRFARPAGSTQPRRLTLGDVWEVVRVSYTSLGGPSRNDQTDPPIWQATDAFVLWLEHATI